VVYDTFSSNDELYAKIKAGGGAGYDIVFPSGHYTSIMINENMFEKIDKSKLTNLENIDPLILQKAAYDPTMEYSVPYFFGAAGIAVNTAKVPNFERNFSIFGRTDLKGRMTMLNEWEVIGDALVYLGYSICSENPAEIEEAKNLINNTWKANLVKFDSDSYAKGYANGDFWVVQCYAEAIYEEISDNKQLMKDTVFFIPSKAGAYIDNMCILKGSQNRELAYKFIDFIYRPEIYAEFVDYFGLPASVNISARQFTRKIPWYSEDEVINREIMFEIGEAFKYYNDAWFNSIIIGN
jgi:spermidine/putrescine transport system substrate-binding protein